MEPTMANDNEDRLEASRRWFKEAQYGLMVHWGLYALLGGEWRGRVMPGIAEWAQAYFRIPNAEYAALAKAFDPIFFDADEWVRIARDAGMRYIVFTSKHHDGFAMFRSKVSRFNVVDATPFGRDVVGELAEACRKHNPKIVLSAALMPEPDSEYYYGQDPAQMGQYLDILMPMIYRHSGGYKKNDEGWAVRVANHFAEKGAPAVVWAGTTTYRDKDPQDFGPEDENPVPMTAEETLVDCRDLTTSKAVGIVLFRFGLGEIPDMHGLWD